LLPTAIIYEVHDKSQFLTEKTTLKYLHFFQISKSGIQELEILPVPR